MESEPSTTSLKVKTIDGHIFEVEVNLQSEVLHLKRILAEVRLTLRENTGASHQAETDLSGKAFERR